MIRSSGLYMEHSRVAVRARRVVGTILGILVVVGWSTGPVLAGMPPIAAAASDSDFVTVSSHTVPTGAVTPIAVQIGMATHTPAAAITIPLTYAGNPDIVLDKSYGTVSEPGVTYDALGNLALWTIKTVEVDTVNKTVLLGFVSFSGSMPPSDGPLATIHLLANAPSSSGGVVIDTLTLPPANVLTIVDESANEYFPQFIPGVITIQGGGGDVPEIHLAPDSMMFSTLLGLPAPPAQYIALSNSGGGTLHWDAWASGDQTWLSVAPISGTGPGSLQVSVNPGVIGGAGTSVGEITVRDLNASNSPQTTKVVLTIGTPSLSTSSHGIIFDAMAGGPKPPPKDFQLTASLGAVIPFVGTATKPWISFIPTTGNTPATIRVTVDPTGLPVGDHVGRITFTSPSANNYAWTNVTIRISDGGNYSDSDRVHIETAAVPPGVQTDVPLKVSVDTKTLAAAIAIPLKYSGDVPLHLDHTVGDQGVTWDSLGQQDFWHVKSVKDDPANKTVLLGLVSFSTGMAPSVGDLATLHFVADSSALGNSTVIDTTFLPPNNFLSIVDWDANEYVPQFDAGMVTVQVVGPWLDVPEYALGYFATQDQPQPPGQWAHVNNKGGGALHWFAYGDSSWIQLSKPSGGDNDSFMVSVDATGLPVGLYKGKVFVVDSLAIESPQQIDIKMWVSAGGGPADSNYVAVSTEVAPLNHNSTVAVEVWMGAKDTLQAVVVPLTFAGNPHVTLDTTIGERGVIQGPIGADPNWAIRPIVVEPDSSRMAIAYISFTKIPPNQGLLATLYFHVNSTATPDTIRIDSTYFPPANHLNFQTTNLGMVVPSFDPGAIILLESVDSICLSTDSVYMEVERFTDIYACTSVDLTNCGGLSDFDWTASATCDFLDYPESGNTGDVCIRPCFSICLNDTGLEMGMHVCTITVSSPTAINSPQEIRVFVNIRETPPLPFDGFYGKLRLADGDSLRKLGPDYVELGTDSRRSDGFEPVWDIFKVPPPPGPYLRIFLPHPEWGQFQSEFQTDVREKYIYGCKDWDFVVETDHLRPVRLSYEHLKAPDRPMSFSLLDAAGNLLVADFLAHDYAFLAVGGRRSFTLRVCASAPFHDQYHPGWNLASSPVAPNNPSWNAIFDGVWRSFQVFGWNGGYYPSSMYPGCGEGYWVFAPDSGHVVYNGTPCFDDSTGAFLVDLDVGWNLFGLPHPSPVELLQFSVDSAGVRMDYLDAISRGWMTPTIWGWNGTSYYAPHVLMPGDGFWIPSILPGMKLVFGPPRDCVLAVMPVVNAGPEFTTVRLAGDEFGVQIGLAEDAQNGFDTRYDSPLPPEGPEPQARLALRSNLHPLFADYAQDIRGMADDVSWRVAIKNGSNQSHQIVVDHLSALESNGYALYLESDGTEAVRLHDGVPQEATGSEFVLHAVRGDTDTGPRPDRYFLAANYPNPFNPDTRIEFGLAASGRVELVIFNVLGQRIRTLIDGEYSAGTHEVTWHGTDDSGIPVASGLYFYRLKTAEFGATRKMLLMK